MGSDFREEGTTASVCEDEVAQICADSFRDESLKIGQTYWYRKEPKWDVWPR